MARKYKRKTAEDKKKEIEELTDGFLEKLDSYFESEESLKEHLRFMGSFHRYSIRNMTLIDDQFMGARAVGSYKFWKEKGANVKKGEKGIKILVPTPVELFQRGDKWVQKRYATEKEKQGIKNGTIETEKKLFFKIGHVFEYTQTNAREKGLEVSDIFKKYHRDGTIEYDNAMMKSLGKVADNLNVTILDEPRHELGTAKGASYPYENEIALNPRNNEFENVTVLIHELAHAKLHTKETRGNYTTEEKEFQAEMVSYVVASNYDIDTEEFSLSYLHGWTKNRELKDKENLLNEVKETSKEFIDIIDQNLEQELQKDRSFSMDNKVNIKSFNREWQDEYELAMITFTNGATGKENDFSIWINRDRDEGTLTKEEFMDSELNVFMSEPTNINSNSYESVEDALSDLEDYTLEDLVNLDDEIEDTLIKYYNGEIDEFNIEVQEEQQLIDAKDVVVNEEITDILMKIEPDALSYSDIVDLGKTLENYDMSKFDFSVLEEELENDFNKELIVTNPNSIREDDLPYINTVFEKTGIEKHMDFSENKQDKENEQGMSM